MEVHGVLFSISGPGYRGFHGVRREICRTHSKGIELSSSQAICFLMMPSERTHLGVSGLALGGIFKQEVVTPGRGLDHLSGGFFAHGKLA